jgi:NAD+ synthase (glutamine-hydrolysing)
VPTLRIALVQADPRVGDLAANSEQVLDLARRAANQGAQLVAFPEMFLTGYPVEDLALRPSFVQASQHRVHTLAAALKRKGMGGVAVVVGHLAEAPRPEEVDGTRQIAQNAASVLHGGKVVATYAKHHLPNYGVFDEQRYFRPGLDPRVLRAELGSDEAVDVGLAICEDLWQPGGPVSEYRGLGTGLVLVINGSPYELNKDDVRLELVRRRVTEAGCALAYVNMTGGQDELVYDGDSLLVGVDGAVIARGPQFTDDIVLADVDLPAATHETGPHHVTVALDPVPDDAPPAPPHIEERVSDEEELWTALVVGLRAYVEKNGFSSVVLGLSGGIDSALTAALACDAIGPDAVFGVALPSKYSSEHSLADAEETADRTGLGYAVIPIEPMVEAFVANLGLSGLAEENVQARVRGTTLMGLSNADGHLVLATGNKSELAVGYSTIYGDAVGGFAPLKDVPKTLVWRLARWRNAAAVQMGQIPPIPQRSIDKAPSAELRPDQTDQDSLPSYDVLDAVVEAYVTGDQSGAEVVEQGFDPDVVEQVFRLIDRAEWKRRQYPMGTKISFRAFGRDRRLPVTNGWREQVPGATPAIPPASTTPAPDGIETNGDEVVIDENGEVDANALHDLLHEAKDRAAAEDESKQPRD